MWGDSVESVHRVLAWGLAVLAVVTLALAAAGWLPKPPSRLLVDRTILAAIVLAVIAVLAGFVLLATGQAPTDPLHYLYALIAVAALPIARFWPTPTRRRGYLLLGAILLVGVVVRLFQTG